VNPPADARPRLSRGTRLSFDRVRYAHVLLYPEGVLFPNQTAINVLRRCDGSNTVAAIADDLRHDYRAVELTDIAELLTQLSARGLLELDSN
jgi:pyrroloquinoline quinone biosynthesis protein D